MIERIPPQNQAPVDSRTTPHSSTGAGTRRLLCILTLTLAIALIFAPACSFDFVRWDDDINVYRNPFFHPVTFGNILYFWVSPYQQLYIPLSYTAYALLAKIAVCGDMPSIANGGSVHLNPHVFHLANILLHLSNTLLVFGVLRLLIRRDLPAAAGALLFAVHPLQVEAVCWISEFRGLLGSFFSLLSIWLFLRHAVADRDHQRRRAVLYFSALGVFLCAMLSKPSAIVVPLIAACLDICLIRKSLRQPLLGLILPLALAIPFIHITQAAQPVPHYLVIPWWKRPVIAADAIAFYAVKIIWPTNLAVDYGRSPSYVLHHAPWLGLTLTAGLLALIGYIAYRRRAFPVAFTVLVIALLPVLGLDPFVFQRFSTVADRYAYLAMLGPSIAVALLLSNRPTRRLSTMPYAVAVIALMVVSLHQVRYWTNSITLFTRTLAVNPNSTFALMNLGTIYFDEADYSRAAHCYTKAMTLQPHDEKLNFDLGLTLFDEGKVNAAVPYLTNAVASDPTNAEAHNDLGVALARKGDTASALREWKRAVYLQPDYAEPRLNIEKLSISQDHGASAAGKRG